MKRRKRVKKGKRFEVKSSPIFLWTSIEDYERPNDGLRVRKKGVARKYCALLNAGVEALKKGKKI